MQTLPGCRPSPDADPLEADLVMCSVKPAGKPTTHLDKSNDTGLWKHYLAPKLCFRAATRHFSPGRSMNVSRSWGEDGSLPSEVQIEQVWTCPTGMGSCTTEIIASPQLHSWAGAVTNRTNSTYIALSQLPSSDNQQVMRIETY